MRPHISRVLQRSVTAATAAILVSAVAAPPTSATEAAETIGYVGGSITRLAVIGYEDLGGDELWSTDDYQLGGGTIFAWAAPGSDYFVRFDQQIAANGMPVSLWWQLAAHDDQVEGLSNAEIYAVAVDVLHKIRQRVGDIPVYTAAMARFAPATGCAQRGNAIAPRRLERTAERLVADGLVEAGPHMPVLRQHHLNGPDSCHQNERGRALHGQVLLDFFGP